MKPSALTTQAPYVHLLDKYVSYLRTFHAPPDVFAPDVACMYHVPGGHYAQHTPRGLEDELRPYGDGSDVTVKGHAPTPDGFVVEFTQRARNGDIYEELAWVRVKDGRIRDIRVYCTGAVHGH